MQRKKEIPTNPRFAYAAAKAYTTLLEFGLNKFPIKAEQVIEEFSDIVEIMPCSKAKKELDSEDPFNLHKLKAEARALKRRDSDIYLIIYDDDPSITYERVNWTILHELAHIILGHLDDFDLTGLFRGGITKKEYGVLEVEAN